MVRAAMNSITLLFVSDCPDSSSVDQDTNAEGKDLDLLWSALYVQESSVVSIAYCLQNSFFYLFI